MIAPSDAKNKVALNPQSVSPRIVEDGEVIILPLR